MFYTKYYSMSRYVLLEEKPANAQKSIKNKRETSQNTADCYFNVEIIKTTVSFPNFKIVFAA